MWPDPQFSEDLVTFTEEILNGKLHVLCSVDDNYTLKSALLSRKSFTWRNTSPGKCPTNFPSDIWPVLITNISNMSCSTCKHFLLAAIHLDKYKTAYSCGKYKNFWCDITFLLSENRWQNFALLSNDFWKELSKHSLLSFIMFCFDKAYLLWNLQQFVKSC